MARGDAIIRDHQVGVGSSLSVLVGFGAGKIRIVEKPIPSEAYTVLLFSFSSSGLTTASVKLIATSKPTEHRLKSYPTKVKIVADGELQINGTNAVMVKRLVLFKQTLPFDFKQQNPDLFVPQSEQYHIKGIVVDQTDKSNIVVFVTETMPTPCYLADENNQCDCRYVLAELLGGLCGKTCRDLNQTLQYDSTASPVCGGQNNTLHVCMFCRKALVRAKEYGEICDDRITKEICVNPLVTRNVSNQPGLKPKKQTNPCGCCVKKRKERDQSEAYVLKGANDCSTDFYEMQNGSENGGRPCRINYNRCNPYPKCPPHSGFKSYSGFNSCSEFRLSPERKLCSEFKNNPECKPVPVNKPCTEGKLSFRPCSKCNCGEILRQECSAAKKGFIASAYYTSTTDIQTELAFENTDFYLICQAYRLKSDIHAPDICNRKILEEEPETRHKQRKKNRLEPKRDHVHRSRVEKGTNYITTFDASEKSSEDSTKSSTIQSSAEEEVKEISIQSTESYLVAKRLKKTEYTDNNLFVGRMEGSNFHTYPFKNQNNFVNRLNGITESHDTCRKFPSISSTSSTGSYLSVGRSRPKRYRFSKKFGLFKCFPPPKTKDCRLGAFDS